MSKDPNQFTYFIESINYNRMKLHNVTPPTGFDIFRQDLLEINAMPCKIHRELGPVIAALDELKRQLDLEPNSAERESIIQAIHQSKNQCIQQARYVMPKAELTAVLDRLIAVDREAGFLSSKRNRYVKLQVASEAAARHFQYDNVRITDYLSYRTGARESIIMTLEYKRWTGSTVSNSTFNAFKQALNTYSEGLGDIVESTERARLATNAQQYRLHRDEARTNLARHAGMAATIAPVPMFGGLLFMW